MVYVGNAYPHKNLSNLLMVVKLLNKKESSKINLVIVSARDVFTKRLEDEIDKLGLKEFVTLTGYLPAEQLSQIFKKASAYIFPSLSEGFGIPGLNAMAAGLPVVCSDIPVLHEVYGEAAIYFNPHDPKDIASKIKKIVTDEKTRADLVKKGKEQVKKYSWQKMAAQTLSVYKEIVNI